MFGEGSRFGGQAQIAPNAPGPLRSGGRKPSGRTGAPACRPPWKGGHSTDKHPGPRPEQAGTPANNSPKATKTSSKPHRPAETPPNPHTLP